MVRYRPCVRRSGAHVHTHAGVLVYGDMVYIYRDGGSSENHINVICREMCVYCLYI